MLPTINLFGLDVSTYGICVSIGLILMFITAFILGRRYKILLEDILFGELSALLGAFWGAHILYAFTNAHYIYNSLSELFSKGRDFGKLWEIISENMGGMVFYGGLIGGLVFGILYCKIRKINVENFSDCFAAAIPLFHCFGRIGCFLSGCCYGIESEFGFTATHSIVSSCNFVNRFPVQLLESGINLIIFFVILFLFRKRILESRLIYVYLISYSFIRFLLEFLRADTYRGIYFGLSTSQWISIAIFAASVIILYKKNKKHKK
jgi:phosphatidylglycerol:prolipoprotein diacylglycerol transferase